MTTETVLNILLERVDAMTQKAESERIQAPTLYAQAAQVGKASAFAEIKSIILNLQIEHHDNEKQH